MFLLDTNVLSEMRKIGTAKINVNVDRWCASVRSTDLFVSVITLQELEQGVMRLERRDAVQGDLLRAWFERSVLSVYRDRILPVTTAIARICAALNVPDNRPLGDALIAATARVHELKVVTRNVGDFDDTGVVIVTPWLQDP